jgi:hypothetical protein
MGTSVMRVGRREGLSTLEAVLGVLVLVLVVALAAQHCHGLFPHQRSFASSPGCPDSVAPSDTTQLRACLSGLTFDPVTAVGDEQRLLVLDSTSGAPCHGNSALTCRHGPLARIEPVIGAHERDTTELNAGRVIARLFLQSGETEAYPKLELAPHDTTFWWVQRLTDSTALSMYLRMHAGSVVASTLDTITIERHPPGTFKMALARFIWAEDDEKTQGPCGVGCCR